jgi:hypothetical protein
MNTRINKLFLYIFFVTSFVSVGHSLRAQEAVDDSQNQAVSQDVVPSIDNQVLDEQPVNDESSLDSGLNTLDEKQENKALEAAKQQFLKYFPSDSEPSSVRPVLFTIEEYQLIEEARLVNLPPEQGGAVTAETAKQIIERGARDLFLSGILFHSSTDWTIWFNKERLTIEDNPKELPDEMKDLKVYSDHIEFNWFDAYTNKIYALKMRPHQRFNIDRRIFLPGAN